MEYEAARVRQQNTKDQERGRNIETTQVQPQLQNIVHVVTKNQERAQQTQKTVRMTANAKHQTQIQKLTHRHEYIKEYKYIQCKTMKPTTAKVHHEISSSKSMIASTKQQK